MNRHQSAELTGRSAVRLECLNLFVSVRCKLGYFNLDPNNPQGCTPCFCFQHSSVCDSAEGFSVHAVSSSFSRGETACRRDAG